MTQQMSKLNSGKIKITNDGNIIMQFSNYHHVIDGDTELYYKHQADKVIAELEMKLASVQQVLRLNTPEALYSDLEIMGRLSHEIDVVARRERYQKYKRCLAMAKWCERKRFDAADYRIPRRKWEFYDKRHKRWLALAEKFKEAKS